MASARMFDGLTGRAVAKVMARSNRAAEEEAIEVLAPSATDAVLVIGIGPGVGVQLLAERLGEGRIAGVDPSGAMIREARRRNRRWIDAGIVELVQTGADRLPWPDGSFAGALAVNSMQLWVPIESSIGEVARVLRPGGLLVALTHDWAIERSSGRTVDEWFARIRDTCVEEGLIDACLWRARAENGGSVAFSAVRAERQ